ncbi:TetR/AcrR family transcriptional regulator [Paraburkholderia sp. D15]|uniref:TetR/AcrR family transcriptional regulator n=1 Tax=Paraburkholderia sp. D15 TaxID=2880218 RepID=UPI00247A094C|nr:TetR/AcrR family transcriptional regulator [Paraburkholderia sp. D15]WGS54225.1 TetR/AcrR family transcriptional regulator [Paraburkholderia sp. D15]WKF60232.1 Nucleoid occlusion factor SlmA [Paraburkholderia busanensis]
MRKEPRQARSRATVEAILVAGGLVLGRRGWARFTTNEVAEIAGVSIGSLYQYFPNKLILSQAITARHFDQILAVLRAIGDATLPLARRVEQLIDGMIGVHSINPALHRVLLEEAPRARGPKSVHEKFDAEYLGCYAALIAQSGDTRTQESIDAAAQVISAAVSGAIHDAAHRGTIGSPALKQELVDMIEAYLLRCRRRARTAPATPKKGR